jgi:hypothetical protein
MTDTPYDVDATPAGKAKADAENRKTKPGDAGHKVTMQDMRDANQDGRANPATLSQHGGAGDIMSGEVDRAGVPMTRAVRDATRRNDAVLGKEEVEAGSRILIHTENGKSFPHPPNTPAV